MDKRLIIGVCLILAGILILDITFAESIFLWAHN